MTVCVDAAGDARQQYQDRLQASREELAAQLVAHAPAAGPA